MNKSVVNQFGGFNSSAMRNFTPYGAEVQALEPVKPKVMAAKADQDYISEVRQRSLTSLPVTVLNCMSFEWQDADGIRQDLLFNKVRTRNAAASISELKPLLKSLEADGKAKKVMRKKEIFWYRIA